jgi:hypothetical protein
MRDKLRAKARLKVRDSPEQVGIESIARCCRSDRGMKSNGSLDSKRDIRVPVSVGFCSYWNGKMRIVKSTKVLMKLYKGKSDARTGSSQ